MKPNPIIILVMACSTLSATVARAEEFVLADLDTGSTLFTNSNEVEVASLSVPSGYDEFQVNPSTNSQDLIEENWALTNGLPLTLTFDVPNPEGVVTNVAWFRDSGQVLPLTNLTAVIEYVRASADVTTEAVETLSVPSWGASWPAVVHLGAIEVGSSSSIGVFSRSLSVDPDADETPEEPETITLSGTNVYTVTLTVMDNAGNTSSDTTTLTVTAGEIGQDTTWTGDVGSDWFDHANWSNYAPGPGATATINAGAVLLNASTPALAELNLTGGTLTFQGWDTVLSVTNVTVAGSVTHAPQSATSTDESGEWIPDNRVHIACTDLTLAEGGRIHGDENGYTGVSNGTGRGPGGGTTAGRGGGYGGAGGNNGGSAYGLAHSPTNAGSAGGGASNDGGRTGGHGGGVVYIAATGHVAVDGTISVDGKDAMIWAGGGSGGSVHITCDTFGGSSNGLIRARGGTTTTPERGGGGGGRIALHYDVSSQSHAPLPGVRLDASGGAPTWASAGRQGTIYLSDASFFPSEDLLGGQILIPGFTAWEPQRLSVSSGVVGFPGPFALTVDGNVTLTDFGGLESSNTWVSVGGDITMTNGAISLHSRSDAAAVLQCDGNLAHHEGGIITLRGDDTNAATLTVAGDMSVTGGATVSLFSNNDTYTYNPLLPLGAELNVGGHLRVAADSLVHVRSDGLLGGSGVLKAKDMTLEAGGWIYARGYGFFGGDAVSSWGRHGQGPGGGRWSGNQGGGGGYGGKGGNASGGAAGGDVYGDAFADIPMQPGSGGASPNNGRGGHGGGAIRLLVDRELTVNGTITADGNPYDRNASGAGSGGSIYIVTRILSGDPGGQISANGGDNDSTGGGGGGGRVAIWRVRDTFAGPVTADPGRAGTGQPGAEGKVILVDIPPPGTLFMLR